jgi:hypothetical protein
MGLCDIKDPTLSRQSAYKGSGKLYMAVRLSALHVDRALLPRKLIFLLLIIIYVRG